MEYKVVALHRQKTLDRGFDAQWFSVWVDILAQWLYSIGAKECSFTSEKDTDNILVLAKFDPEPDHNVLADIVMQDGIKTEGPMRLESFDPYTLQPVLAAWRHMQDSFIDERDRTTKLLEGFVGQIEDVVAGRTYIRLYKSEHPAKLKFPHSEEKVAEEREKIAAFVEKGYWAPTDGTGCCLECKRWVPVGHPERGDHEDWCKSGKGEWAGAPGLAEKIRSRK